VFRRNNPQPTALIVTNNTTSSLFMACISETVSLREEANTSWVKQLYNALFDVQTRRVVFFPRALFFRHTRTLILGYI
jgi:hypothetical protein